MEDYHKIMTFAKAKSPHGGFGNLYLARTIDRDGNVTSETYGMNMMTEYGMNLYFGDNSKPDWPNYLYIGNSTDRNQSQINDNVTVTGGGHKLFSYDTTEHDVDNARDTTVDYHYPMYYYKIPGTNPENGIVTCVAKFRRCKFGYSINGIGQPIQITEYGIGTGPQQLWTHSWVYDKTGRYTQITKSPNEELEITIFLCMSYKTNVITDEHANGRFPVITTLERFISNRMDETTFGTYGRYDAIVDRNNASSVSYSEVKNHSQTRTRYLTSFNIMNSADNDQGYIDGFYSYTNGFVVIEPQYLSANNAEQFSSEIHDTFGNFYPYSISNLFGKKIDPQIPVTQLSITQASGEGCWLYNRFHEANQDGYSNPISYTNDSDYWYTETPMQANMACPIYVTDINDTIVELYVHQNLHPENPILQFNNTTIGTIYGTDDYWNRAKWTRIENPFAIPSNLRTCRYYITNSNEVPLQPVRQKQPFTLTPSVGENKTYEYALQTSNVEFASHMSCENYTRGYFCKNNLLYVPSSGLIYQIGVSGNKLPERAAYTDYIQHFCYDKIIVTTDYGTSKKSNIILTSVDDITAPTSVDYQMMGVTEGFTTINNWSLGDHTYKTESNTGLICFQSLSADECVVLDLTRRDPGSVNPYVKKLFQSKIACAIFDTRTTASPNYQRIAYLTTDTTNPSIKIYDFNQSSDVLELQPPNSSGTALTDITCIWGLNDHLWASNGSTWAWHWNLSSGNTVGESCLNHSDIFSNKADLYRARITAVDDIIMLYDVQDVTLSHVYFNRIDERQTTIFDLRDFEFSKDGATRSYYKLKYIEDGKTLALIGDMYVSGNYGGIYHIIIDLGQYVNPPTGYDPIYSKIYYELERNTSSDIYPSFITYGENVIYGKRQIPIALMMPMQIKGKTRTISAVNYTKHLSDKTFNVTFTNTPPDEWSEDKPGYPLGTLN